MLFNFITPSGTPWAVTVVFAILVILHLGLLRISPQHRYIVQTSILLFSSLSFVVICVTLIWDVIDFYFDFQFFHFEFHFVSFK